MEANWNWKYVYILDFGAVRLGKKLEQRFHQNLSKLPLFQCLKEVGVNPLEELNYEILNHWRFVQLDNAFEIELCS